MSDVADRSDFRIRVRAIILLCAVLATSLLTTLVWVAWSEEPAQDAVSDVMPEPLAPRFRVVRELPDLHKRPVQERLEVPPASEVDPGASSRLNGPYYLVLSFVDGDGSIVPSVRFSLESFTGQERSVGELRADAGGECIIEFPALPSRTSASITDWDWHAPLAAVQPVGPVDRHKIVLTRLVEVSLDIRYSDGEPYSGKITFSDGIYPYRAEGQTQHGVGRARGETIWMEHTPVIVEGICASDGAVRVYPTRPGYEFHSFQVAESGMFAGARLSLVVPRSKHPSGSITLKFTNAAKGEHMHAPWSYELNPQDLKGSEGRSTVHELPPGGEHFLPNIRAGTYRVTVWQGGEVWTEELVVADAKDTHCNVVLREAASASVRVLDGDGRAISGAVLHREDGVQVDYPVQPRRGVRAASNREGEAILEGLSPGSSTLWVEAAGMEAVKLEATLYPGRATDLGTVVLTPAMGVVRVIVKGVPEGTEWRVACRHPWGKGGAGNWQLVTTDGRLEFAGLQLREYLIAAWPAAGGKGVSLTARLTHETHEVEVVLDLSAPATTTDE